MPFDLLCRAKDTVEVLAKYNCRRLLLSVPRSVPGRAGDEAGAIKATRIRAR
jgi:hypothetical protein